MCAQFLAVPVDTKVHLYERGSWDHVSTLSEDLLTQVRSRWTCAIMFMVKSSSLKATLHRCNRERNMVKSSVLVLHRPTTGCVRNVGAKINNVTDATNKPVRIQHERVQNTLAGDCNATATTFHFSLSSRGCSQILVRSCSSFEVFW